MQIDFGKYADKTLEEIAEIEPSYLLWLIREQTGSAELRAEAGRVLVLRGAFARPINNPRLPAWLWPMVGALVVLAVMALNGRFQIPATLPASMPQTSEPTLLATIEQGLPTAAAKRAASYLSPMVDPTSTNFQFSPTEAMAPVNLTPTRGSCGGRIAGAIRADQVHDYVGDFQKVEFQVVRTYNSGKAVFLDSHDPFDGYFEVVIFPERWSEFPAPPEQYFKGKCVGVRGRLQLYRGTPQIVLRSADDIEIVE